MANNITGRWYVVSFLKHKLNSSSPHGFMIETPKNIEGHPTYEAALVDLKLLKDDKFPCVIIRVENSFDRVEPERPTKLETKRVVIDPWEVL